MVLDVTALVKSVVFPITLFAILAPPSTTEAANAEPGRLGKLKLGFGLGPAMLGAGEACTPPPLAIPPLLANPPPVLGIWE